MRCTDKDGLPVIILGSNHGARVQRGGAVGAARAAPVHLAWGGGDTEWYVCILGGMLCGMLCEKNRQAERQRSYYFHEMRNEVDKWQVRFHSELQISMSMLHSEFTD